jgi:hypothetical protein
MVGHGRSLLGRGMGSRIDQHVVIRMGMGLELLGDDYGRRTDFFFTFGEDTCSTGLLYPPGAPRGVLQAKDSLGRYLDPDVERANDEILKMLDLLHCHGRLWVRPISSGFNAVVMAAAFLKPETVILAGFDNLWAGTPEGSREENALGDERPQHRHYDEEKRMLPLVEERYAVKIRPLFTPEEDLFQVSLWPPEVPRRLRPRLVGPD